MKKRILLSLATALCIFMAACSGSGTADQPKDEKLSGFMLGGIYFIQGYGGQVAVNGMVAGTNKKEIVAEYKNLLEFPFKPEDGAADAKRMLDSWWGIKDKAGLVQTFEELKKGNAENPHRAWDYARLVNNACMAYAAGYLTKDEAAKYVAEVLPLAKKDFKTWDDYYKDFLEGRKIWKDDAAENKEYEGLVKDIMTGDKSIYKILPLNG